MTFDPDDALNERTEDVAALDATLAKLLGCDLAEWDQDFVDDLVKKLDRRGNAMKLTALQEEQLDRMRRQYGI